MRNLPFASQFRSVYAPSSDGRRILGLRILYLPRVFLGPTIPAPLPRAIFTTSGWPLLTHHGRHHCRRLAFLVGLKTIIVIPKGARCHPETGGAPIRSPLPSRAPRTYGVTRNGSRGRFCGAATGVGRNKNARKKRAAAVGITRY